MAEREVTVKLNLKPGDTSQFKNLFSPSNPNSPTNQAQNTVQNQFKGIAANIQKSAGALTSAFSNLGGATGPAGAGIGLAGSALSVGVGALAGGAVGAIVAAAIETITESLKGLLEMGKSFAGLNAPGTIIRFDLALHTLQATIGKFFVPILEALIPLTRTVADFLETIMPGPDAMRGLTDSMRELFSTLRDIFKEISPEIKLFVQIMLDEFKKLLQNLNLALKLAFPFSGNAPNLKSSAGNLAYPASFTNAGSYARQVYAAAGNQSSGQGLDPAAQTAANTAATVALLQQIQNQLAGNGSGAVADSGASRGIPGSQASTGATGGTQIGMGLANWLARGLAITSMQH